MKRLRSRLSDLWYWRVGRYCNREAFANWIAWRLPKRIALAAFVRVSCSTREAPTQAYADAYLAFEKDCKRGKVGV